MAVVDLNQFASLFEIGFALHFAVAFLDRIYAKELPTRIETIAGRAKSLEALKRELSDHSEAEEKRDLPAELRFTHRVITEPEWTRHNDYVLDRVHALRQEVKGQMKALRSILNVIAVLSILVVLYSITTLFLIGLGLDVVKNLDPMTASVVVLMQLLPLPVAAAVFFVVARRMSNEVDRKIRGVGELQLVLNDASSPALNNYASVEQVYHRYARRAGLSEPS